MDVSFIEIINPQAKSQGWQIIADENGDMLAEYRVDPAEKTVAVVERAWDEEPLALLALQFLREQAPLTYVRAIYAAHSTTLAA